MTRVLVLSNEPLGEVMAGPAIRATELARVLADRGHDVTLRETVDRPEVRRLAGEADVVLLQGWVLERVPALADSGARIVVDLYDPFGLELLMLIESEPVARREAAQANALRALHDQLRAGDFFLCASERQRDYWLGWLEALGRVNPRTHGADPDLRGLIDVVPFGVPSEPPCATRGPGPRATFGIGADELMLLWGGGVYDWFDPVTVVRAVERVEGAHLVFMAAGHPNSELPTARALGAAREAAGPRVHFHDGWVEYDRRADWLLDADAGVSAHHDTSRRASPSARASSTTCGPACPCCARAGTRWPTRCSARTWAPRWRRGTSTGGWRRWRTSRTRSAARRAAPAPPTSRAR